MMAYNQNPDNEESFNTAVENQLRQIDGTQQQINQSSNYLSVLNVDTDETVI